MNLSEPFIRRPVMTILVMASILFFGFAAYGILPVSDLPNVDLPTIEVSVSYPGASPETMANAVTTPLEQQFMTIEGIQGVFSTSNTGSTTIVLQFDLDRNIDAASTDVQAAISRAQPNLPSNLPNQPTYQKVNPAATPIVYYAITSPNMTMADLYDYGNTFIGERLSMIEGVAQVSTYGAPYAVRVQIDPEKLAAKNLGLDSVTESIRLTNVDLPLGTLYGERDDFTIDVDGQILKAPGYSELVIKNQNGDLVKIKDVGRALDSISNDKFFQHYVTHAGSERCVILAIRRLPGKNTVQIVQGIEKTLKALRPQLPSSLKIESVYDQSVSIIEGVNDVKLTLIVAFLLVVAVIYLALGKALNTIIPAISLPMSIFGTFAVIYLLGFSIDILSLLAITLSIGFLIDDSIVVLENNVRHVQMGESPMDGSLKGSKEISVTVLSMTLCLVAAFIPLVFMGGVVGKLFQEFAVTIIVAVLISGFVSLTLVPMLSSKFVKPYNAENKTKMEKMADAVNEKMKRMYEPCLHFAMNHRLIMLTVGSLCILFSLVLFKVVAKDFLPPDDIGFLQGYTLARDGTSPFLMNKYHEEINKIAIDDPNMDSIISISSYSNPNEGVIFFRLKEFKDRKPMQTVMKELGEKFKQIPGVNVYLSPLPIINLQVGTTAQALYQYSLTSIDRNALYEYAPKLVAKMKNNPAFAQVSSDLRIHQPQWQMHILRDKASNYNVSASAIENYFQYAYSDNKISQINGQINQYNVLIETLPEFYRNPKVLSKLYVTSTDGNQVPLSEVLEVKETVGPLTVNHINGLSSVGISFNTADNVPLGNALEALNQLTKGEAPPQVYGQVIGTADIFKSSFSNLVYLLLLSFFVIYVVLGILYESFIHPITVMSALPPTVFGGLLTLYIFNQTLSIYSFVGLILLIGIVLKNGIMMVDFAIIAVEKEGKSAYDAIIEACLIRFRPIMMTTVCAIMGGVPIAIGIGGAMAQSHISLGLCIVGGLIISQMLTLLLTPVLYYYFETLQEKIKGRFSRVK
ncbi:MAG: acriflavine resistance protein B [Chlamydiae bacterium CG10_big_fil_rev_8_21_14_0_10_42_34]|nr:MAG: acriflavine resistance protein B [Chlamydiae bacterium CG10_big_fil_rev_8_21_14_0_10_42_34]